MKVKKLGMRYRIKKSGLLRVYWPGWMDGRRGFIKRKGWAWMAGWQLYKKIRYSTRHLTTFGTFTIMRYLVEEGWKSREKVATSNPSAPSSHGHTCQGVGHRM